MIEESYVSFETARLLKEAGFDVPCDKQYSERGVQWDASCLENFNADDWGCSCPTQALAARWLREAHGIHVFPVYQYLPEKWSYVIQFLPGKWSYVIQNMTYVNSEKGMHTDVFSSCEESLEAGLREAIKLIKN